MNIYNLLIVDDEKFIVDWLESMLVDFRDFQIEIFGTDNPMAALEIMKKTRIDLMISDIQMPKITGVDLAEKLREIWPGAKIIFLSAFPNFYYAQKGIDIGVQDYILKTAMDNEIYEKIKNALCIIEEERKQILKFRHMERDLKKFQAEFNRRLFHSLLNGSYQSAESECENVLEALGFPSSPKTEYVLIHGKLNAEADENDYSYNRLMKYFQAQQITSDCLGNYIRHSFFEVYESSLVGIIQMESYEQYNTLLSGVLELAQEICQMKIGKSISYLISPTGTVEEMSNYWVRSQKLMCSLGSDDSYIYVFEKSVIEETDSSKNAMLLLNSTLFDTMNRQLECGNEEGFYDNLSIICRHLSMCINWHDNICLEIYYRLMTMFISYINRYDLSEKVAFYAGIGILFRPWLLDSWENIEKKLFEVSDALLNLHREERKQKADDIICTVNKYIDAHLSEQISLMDLSQKTGYSSSYLSRFYSETNGMTVSDYVASRKLDRIKELMLYSDLSMGDIAKKVGIESRTYFNNYVKRLTGLPPQKYKETLLQQKAEPDIQNYS